MDKNLKNSSKNFYATNQRQLILDFLARTEDHPTAQTIYQIIKKSLPRISLATVYRNLVDLESQGQVSSLIYSKNQARFELNRGQHYHFICSRCDSVTPVELDELLELCQQVSKRHNLQIDSHCLYFFGLCSACRKKNK